MTCTVPGHQIGSYDTPTKRTLLRLELGSNTEKSPEMLNRNYYFFNYPAGVVTSLSMINRVEYTIAN